VSLDIHTDTQCARRLGEAFSLQPQRIQTFFNSHSAGIGVPSQYGLIERRRDYRSFHPDVDATKVFAEKQYFDFRTVSGVKTAFGERQVNWKTGVLVNSTMVNSLAFNPQTRPGELTRGYVAPASLERAR